MTASPVSSGVGSSGASATSLPTCPNSPLNGALGFTPLPAEYFLFLLGMTGTYLLLVEAVKRRLTKSLMNLSLFPGLSFY